MLTEAPKFDAKALAPDGGARGSHHSSGRSSAGPTLTHADPACASYVYVCCAYRFIWCMLEGDTDAHHTQPVYGSCHWAWTGVARACNGTGAACRSLVCAWAALRQQPGLR